MAFRFVPVNPFSSNHMAEESPAHGSSLETAAMSKIVWKALRSMRLQSTPPFPDIFSLKGYESPAQFNVAKLDLERMLAVRSGKW